MGETRTIRQQLTLRLLLTFGVPLVLAGVASYVVIRANLVDRVDASLFQKTEAIVSATTLDDGRFHVDPSPAFMREFDGPNSERGGLLPVSFFEMYSRDGQLVARSASLNHTALSAGIPMPFHPTFWTITLPSGLPVRALAFPFVPRMPHEGDASGPIEAFLIVAVNRQELDSSLNYVEFVLLSIGFLLAATVAIGVKTGLRRALMPLDALAERASRIDADSLSTRFPAVGLPGELQPIATRLNDLLSRLEHSFDRERQFSANVAHELRTPLAELRALAELALKWPDARQAADVDRDTLAIASQMEGIVTRLLALLRSERGQLEITREPVALAAMVRSAWVPFADREAAKVLDVTWRLEEDVVIEADPVLLRSILANLIENAVDYTPPRGVIWVELDRASMRIANTVDTLTSEDVSKLFDRFWRQDAARSGTEHAGLGLSLARAFAEALHFELTATLDTETRMLTLHLAYSF